MMCCVAAATRVYNLEKPKQDQLKKEAGEIAAKMIEDGMVVGLGTGSTAACAIEAIGNRIAREGLRIVGIPTSEGTAAHAEKLRIPLTTFAKHTLIDLTIDGADEILPGPLYLIKGHGGALLREKIVAASSARMVVVADETKIVKTLGELTSVPTEIVPFGWEATQKKLEKLNAKPKLRLGADGKPFITDGGHYILDCAFGAMADPKEIAHHLDHVVGLVEHGLFLKFATEAVVASPGGAKILKKQS